MVRSGRLRIISARPRTTTEACNDAMHMHLFVQGTPKLPFGEGRPIVALTCVNAERTLLSRNDTLPDLAFFAPYA